MKKSLVGKTSGAEISVTAEIKSMEFPVYLFSLSISNMQIQHFSHGKPQTDTPIHFHGKIERQSHADHMICVIAAW